MVFLGGIIAVALAVSMYFLGNLLLLTTKERISAMLFLAGIACGSAGGFLLSSTVGYFVLGGLLLTLGILLAYDGDGQ